MTLAGLLFYLLTVWGVAYVASYSQIGEGLRNLIDYFGRNGFASDLIRCPACVGFWIGGFWWYVSPYVGFHFTADNGGIGGAIAAGFAACGSNRLIAGSFFYTEEQGNGEET